jgi:hypothetical protein
VPIAVLAMEERWNQELCVITGFAYYEIKSVCDMLRPWDVDVSSAYSQ